MNSPIFVVGTGRCGSTMLSNMLRAHRDVLSISEFFSLVSDLGGRIPALFPTTPIDGAAFWDLISAITPRACFAIKHDLAMPEVLYPFASNSARFNAESGVPAILQAVLPHITDDFDALFAELQNEVPNWPLAGINTHYLHLFQWLQQRFGKKVWLERSGGVFVIAEPLHATFPDARYVHIVRDGRDTAVSIQQHIGFRMFIVPSMMAQMLGVDPFYSEDRSGLANLPEAFHAFLPESFNADAFRGFRVPLAMCGGLWSQQIANGIQTIGSLPPERLLTLRYEDFLSDASTQLEKLAAFLGKDFVDSDWVAQCASMVRAPHSHWRDLPAEQQAELQAACQPGFDLLRSIGVEYP